MFPFWRHSLRDFARTLFIVAPIALVTGAACALFLRLLDLATNLRNAHPALLLGLPLGGVVIAYFYEHHGKNSARGNNLILEAVHGASGENPDDDSSLVPRRMAPLILLATLLTHGFGGSAGREGTAVQMGGSIASAWAQTLGLSGQNKRLALLCGVAAGFGGVFGTPLAGAAFALEVLWRGKIETEDALCCLLAALSSDWCARALGAHHHPYVVEFASSGGDEIVLAFKVAFAAVLFGLAARAFIELTEAVSHVFKTRIKNPLARPFVGGLGILALTWLLGTRDYLGLSAYSPDAGAITLGSAFESGAPPLAWFAKTVFTALTLGSGFKGGEVTPLFFVGATLGNALSSPLGAPMSLLAAAGLVGVFAGASKTPLASTLLGIELFGAQGAPMFALACFVAARSSGSRGLYRAQKVVAVPQHEREA